MHNNRMCFCATKEIAQLDAVRFVFLAIQNMSFWRLGVGAELEAVVLSQAFPRDVASAFCRLSMPDLSETCGKMSRSFYAYQRSTF